MVIRGRRDTEMVDKLHFASMTFCSPETAYQSKAADLSLFSVCMSDFTLYLLQNETCN